MYRKKEIFYKNTAIHKIEDLKATFPTNKSKDSKYSNLFRIAAEDLTAKLPLKERLRTELIASQRNLIPENYTLENMLLVQEHLEALDCLETIKYAPFTVNAKQMLYEYLYSKYDISACNLLPQSQNMAQNNKFSSTDDIPSFTKTLSFQIKQIDSSHSRSVRKYVSDYLSAQSDFNQHPNTQCGLYFSEPSHKNTSQKGKNDNVPKPHCYLPLYEVPIFLLLFTFFDRRDFEHTLSQTNQDNLPRRKFNTDEAVYNLVFNKAQDICNTHQHTPLSKSYIWRCDNIFLFQKFNTLLKYYDLYSSPETLYAVAKNYNFEYGQTEKIKSIIYEVVFEDMNFIRHGLKSKYLDFMLPFNIFFQFDIFAPNPGASPEKFKAKLIEIKEKTRQITGTKLSLKCNNPILSFSKDDYFSIPENEKNICDFLEKNNFYSSFYSQTKFLDKFLADSKDNNDFYSYNTIKTIIEENINS